MEENEAAAEKPTTTPQSVTHLVCPHCGADPLIPCAVQYRFELSNGGSAIVTLVGCQACRKAIGSTVFELPPRVLVPSGLTTKRKIVL